MCCVLSAVVRVNVSTSEPSWIGTMAATSRVTRPRARNVKERAMSKSAANMTVEEFAEELARIRQKAWYIKTVVGTRQDRAYKNQKRGDFYGAKKNGS
tara:strand:+ start:406 stop:699 length:294 start_codon:yes stop_codon:yes gene_type:complete